MSHRNDTPLGYVWLLSQAVAAFSDDSLPYCLMGAIALGAHGTQGRPKIWTC